MRQVGAIQKLYEDYKDIANFRIVYIREAHAADSSWPVPYAKKLKINQPTTYGQRCDVARRLLKEKKLTIPCLIDGMDNRVNDAYQAWPDRLYLVRTDGRLAVAANRGPWGLKPALDEAAKWLAAFKETGNEPPPPKPPVDKNK